MPKTLTMMLGTQAFDVQEVYPTIHGGRVWIVGGLMRDGQTRPETVSFAIEDVLRANESISLRREPDLPEPRHHVGIASVGGSLYAIGGMLPGGFALTDASWVLRPHARAWAQIAPLPRARAAGLVMNVAGSLIVASGQEANMPDRLSQVALRYEAADDRWVELAALAQPRDHAAGFVHEAKLYVVGGRRISLSSPVAETEVYDPVRNTWSTLPKLSLASPRGGLAAAQVGSRVYVIGGELATSAFERIDILDLSQMTWMAPATLPASTGGPRGRHGHGALALPDGRVMVIGGANIPNASALSTLIVLDAVESPG